MIHGERNNENIIIKNNRKAYELKRNKLTLKRNISVRGNFDRPIDLILLFYTKGYLKQNVERADIYFLKI